ncbi:hypothetical protein JX265_010426 [Neoarthrinium moseri]|uniref:Aminoglycoside phosphotransferase domain-containing protein n=1 Tax=Neoarthrinium moseri TaxID=1658444 RepID=A0A9P9WEJ4_9PEZI|nr:hypothetical protein JX265_010426 [Neoarthrinium moseri]
MAANDPLRTGLDNFKSHFERNNSQNVSPTNKSFPRNASAVSSVASPKGSLFGFKTPLWPSKTEDGDDMKDDLSADAPDQKRPSPLSSRQKSDATSLDSTTSASSLSTSPPNSIRFDEQEGEMAPLCLFGPAAESINPFIRALQLQYLVKDSIEEGRTSESGGRALAYATRNWLESSRKGQREWEDANDDPPCAVCCATQADAARSVLDEQFGFCSSLNLQYNDYEQYAWSFGSRYVIVEKQHWNLRLDSMPTEVWATRMLRKLSGVPVPDVVAAWKEGHVAITITERARGRRLSDIWNTLSEAVRVSIAKQVAECVKKWRRINSPKISALDGSPYLTSERMIGGSEGQSLLFETEGQYREHIREQLAGEGWDDDFKDLTLRLMPGTLPFVFTHGNLTLNNIFIENELVSAITGLDRAAYLPVWAESLATHFAYGTHEREWKGLLFKYIAFPEIKGYWNVCQDLQIAKSPKGTDGNTKAKGETPARRVTLSIAHIQSAGIERNTKEQLQQLDKQQLQGKEQKKIHNEELKARLEALVEEKERKEAEATALQDEERRRKAPKKDLKAKRSTKLVMQSSSAQTEPRVKRALKVQKRPEGLAEWLGRHPSQVAGGSIGDADEEGNTVQDRIGSSQAKKRLSEDERTPGWEAALQRAYRKDGTGRKSVLEAPRKHVLQPEYGDLAVQASEPPLTPNKLIADNPAHIIYARHGTSANVTYPAGFHIMRKTGKGDDCGLISILKSLQNQFKRLKSQTTLPDLRSAMEYAKHELHAQNEVNVQFYSHLDQLALALRYWNPNAYETVDIQLGCVFKDGREYRDPYPIDSSTTTLWIYSHRDSAVSGTGPSPKEHYYGLQPVSVSLAKPQVEAQPAVGDAEGFDRKSKEVVEASSGGQQPNHPGNDNFNGENPDSYRIKDLLVTTTGEPRHDMDEILEEDLKRENFSQVEPGPNLKGSQAESSTEARKNDRDPEDKNERQYLRNEGEQYSDDEPMNSEGYNSYTGNREPQMKAAQDLEDDLEENEGTVVSDDGFKSEQKSVSVE